MAQARNCKFRHRSSILLLASYHTPPAADLPPGLLSQAAQFDSERGYMLDITEITKNITGKPGWWYSYTEKFVTASPVPPCHNSNPASMSIRYQEEFRYPAVTAYPISG